MYCIDREKVKEIDRIIRYAIESEGKSKFVIYTNGAGGRLVKEYLKEQFALVPEYTIDNKVFNGKDVLNIEQAKERNNEHVYFLICSWDLGVYDEIREVIYEAFPKEQIIDIFPDRAEPLPTNKEIFNVLHYIDTYIRALSETQ